jgi:shikimate dehydrogenase
MPFHTPTSSTGLLLLLGDPVAHSLSPTMHNQAIARLGLPVVYLAARVTPEILPEAIQGLRALGVIGANVTVPHKEAVIELLDELTDRARAIGAVNTISRKGDMLIGDNTDVEGFLSPILRSGFKPKRPLILGAGGAARAVAYALRESTTVRIAARRPDQARALLAGLGIDGEALSLTAAANAVGDSDLIVNTTPLGGPGREDDTALVLTGDLTGQLVYDLIYSPSPTRFLREAASRGAHTIGGLPMLRAQASASFKIWTGHAFPD